MKRFLAAIMLVASTATYAHGEPTLKVCTEIAVDALEGFDMTGKPRLYEGQILRRIVAAEDGDNLDMFTVETSERLWDHMRDLLCGVTELTPDQPVGVAPAPQDCQPDKVWYGCNPGISK
jgi:hypothetical protein